MKPAKLLGTLVCLIFINFLQAQGDPNIILIIADDMGWNQVSSTATTNIYGTTYESDFYETPSIDVLASEGIAFPYAYVNGANCAPTRAALLSGQYAARPHNNVFTVYDLNRGNTSSNSNLIGPDMGIASNGNIDEIPSSAITIAETLQIAGYTTAHFGKYHVGEFEDVDVSHNAATDQGFNYNYGGGTDGGPGDYFALTTAAPFSFGDKVGPELDLYADPYTETESIALSNDHANYPLTGTKKHVTDAMVEAAFDFMDNNSTDPFFMHFSNFAIHGPFNDSDARPDFRAKYVQKAIDSPGTMDHHTKPGQAALAEHMDQAIGRLIEYLTTTDDPRNTGHSLAENTIVYFIADNGDAIKRSPQYPLRGMKGEYYEGGIRSVTFAWSDPVNGLLRNAGGSGEIDYTPIIAFDLYPTFVEAAGGTLPNNYDIDGVSQWQMLTQGTSISRDALFWHHPGYLIDSKRDSRPVTVVRKGDYKLMHFYEDSNYELYHLVNDINEQTNLLPSTDQAIIDIANDMITEMNNHLTDTNAPFPTYRDGGATVPVPAPVSIDGTNPTYGCQPITSYEAYWDFDSVSTTDDISGNNNNQVAIDGTASYNTSDFIEGDQSIIFDGSTEITYDSGTFLNDDVSARTVSAWIKPTGLSGVQTIFEEGGSGNGLTLRLNGTTLEARVINGTGNGDVSCTYPNDNEWHHIALVLDETSNTFTLYIDGIQEDSNSNTNNYLSSHNSPGGIGGIMGGDAYSSDASTNNYTGLMDAFAVYNIALTESQIQANTCLSFGCSTINKTDFQAFWDFDNGNANDVSGSGYNPLLALDASISFDNSDFRDGNQSIVFTGQAGIQYSDYADDDLGFLNEALTKRTVTAWIKPTALGGLQNIFEEGGLNTGIAARLNNSDLEFIVRESSSNANQLSTTFPNDGEWHHVAFVYNGTSTTQTIYIDGVLATTETSLDVPTAIGTHDSKDGIGGKISGKDSFQNTSDNAFFNGKMDGIGVSTDALSLDQIESLTTSWYLGIDNDVDTYYGSVFIVNQCSSPGASYSDSPITVNDCDDSESNTNPGALEVPANGIDDDCDGTTDESNIFTYNDSWSPMSPLGVSSYNDIIVISSGDAMIDENTTVKSITVNPGCGLTVTTGTTLTIDDAVNGITLESTSSMYSSLIVDGTVAGTVNYSRHVNSYSNDATANDNDLISPPLNGESFSSFTSNNSGLILQQGTSPITYAFANFNTNSGNYENHDSNSVFNLGSGIGYRVATSASNTNLNFTGTPETGNVNIEIPVGTDNSYGPWNLVGNPYPSYLDFDSFFDLLLTDNKLETGYIAVYGYDGNAANGWTIWDGNNGQLIAPGQAFFVRTKSALLGENPAPSISFNPTMRSTGNSDDFIAGRNATSSNASLQLISGSDQFDTNIYFRADATNGLDNGYDTSHFQGTDHKFYSNLITDNTGLELFNQAIPLDNINNTVVPLGLTVNSGEQFTVTLNDNISNLPEGTGVFLEDNVNGTFTPLHNTDFVLTPQTSISGTGRFYIHFMSEALSNSTQALNNLLVLNNTKQKTIEVNGILFDETEALVYDLHGRLITRQSLDLSSSNNSIPVERLSTGIYVVVLENSEQTLSQKLIIKN